VRDGRLEADVSIDVAAERARAAEGLREGLFDGDASRALRDALRLASFDGAAPFEPILRDVALRSEYGFGHILACSADLVRFSRDGDLEPTDAIALLTSMTSETLAREPVRPAAEATIADAAALDLALEEERVADAEGAARGIARSRGGVAAIDAMLPFGTRHLLSYGHGLIYLAKARELALLFEGAAEELAASLALALAWSTRETSLPPFRTTQKAMVAASGGGDRELSDRGTFDARVLAGERYAVEAVLVELAEGTSPRALLLAIGRAAAERLRRFDPRWPLRHDMDAGLLDVSHLVTYAQAAIACEPLLAREEAARAAVLTAGFVGKLRRADREAPPSARELSFDDALERRDGDAARASLDGMDASRRANLFRELRPFAAFEAAVRPISVMHAVKTAEALARLAAIDPEGERVYVDALVHLLVPRWRERFDRRAAAIADRFLRDGRPPDALY
jgi:hypothetical protein